MIATIAMTANSVTMMLVGNRQDADLHHLQKGGVGVGQGADRHGQRGHRGDQDVDDTGGEHAADQGTRERLGRVDGLLGDVGGVLEAGHREEGQRDAGDDGEDAGLPSA